jgi:hypothetical protein
MKISNNLIILKNMKTIFTRTMLFLALIANMVAVAAQTPVTHVPYICGFENAEENANWILNPLANASVTLVNKWTIGSAEKKSGDSAMYINGFAPALDVAKYSANAGITVVYRELQLPADNYDISFDWITLGEGSGDALYVYVVPASVAINSNTVSTIPYTSLLLKYPEQGNINYLSGSSSWKQARSSFTTGAGLYKLVFLFAVNSNNIVNNPGGCIDNINIARKGAASSCYVAPANLQVNANAVSWTGSAPKYEIQYNDYYSPTVYTAYTTTNSYIVPSNIPEGIYSFRVRSICNADTSIYIGTDYVLVYSPTAHCIDYLTLTDANCWIGTVYPVYNLYSQHKVVNFGYASYTENNNTPPYYPSTGDLLTSRHTVHYIPGETDPIVPALKTKPDGAIASVRIGNANVNSYAEAVEYQYTVDAQNPGILLLKWAGVIENPSHGGVGSRIICELLDQNGQQLDQCTVADYTYQQAAAGPWNSYNDGVWKDWTPMGINLNNYAGQTITIRITTLDCDATGHYAYAYFTLDCQSSTLQEITVNGESGGSGESCGEKPQRFEAPEGYRYKWYQKYDPYHTELNDERVFYLTPSDTATYCVDMISLLNPNCYYTLEASSLKKMPKARAEFEWKPENCQNWVNITNKSGVFGYYTPSGSSQDVEIDLERDCDSYIWDFGSYGTYYGNNPSPILFPNTGDTITVRLTVGMNNDACTDTASFILEVPAIKQTESVRNLYVCNTDLPYTDPVSGDIFTRAETHQYFSKNFAGCDSIINITLRTLTTQTKNDPERILCDGDTIMWRGQIIRTTGLYESHLPSAIAGLSCDSIIYKINVIVNPSLSIVPNDNSFNTCAGDNLMELSYTVNSGNPLQAQIIFSPEAIAAGFENIDYPQVTNPLPLEIPATTPPGIYNATLRITGDCPPPKDLPFAFVVNYPSNIITQRWNDVLSVTNELFNGGYTFDTYQWYKNGVEITGETGSYIYIPAGLDMSACYSVKLVQHGKTEAIFTCDYCPTVLAGGITITPTLVIASDQLKVEVPEDATVSVFNTQGVKIAIYQLNMGINTITAPSQNGIYLYKIMLKSGDERTFRISVH